MRQQLVGFLAAIFALMPQVALSSNAESSVTDANQVSDDVALATLLDFLVPARLQMDFDIKACEQVFRNGLMRNASELQVELPGVIDHMVDSAATYCKLNIPPIYERKKDEAISRINRTLTKDDIQRLYPQVSKFVSQMESANFNFNPGESFAQGQERYIAIYTEIVSDFAVTNRSFKKNSENALVSEKMLSIQNEGLAGLDQMQSEIMAIFSSAQDAGMDAGNEFALKRGKEPIFGP